ncbi:SusC/RagA family TonB-linked outer membrane protein [Pseudoflavitalea sp. X16]|uniref:SusC/RagA family TonB-linked outer membrane protein n=1 Tax=Paraflavitalea devenefica TaxID=2716334 RepID=UPI001422A578|nr:SusC/RagA family TonB-linked outer membrane protein [Paraflavitalea devenefica]NII29868.1 SusC/RagA family TonB-linked outer membrane protein [Paraflavitalea devenefica]
MQRSTTEQRQSYTGIATHVLNNCSLRYALVSVILLFFFSVRVYAGEPRQDITLSFREATLDKVFKEIRKQTGYSFVYTETEIQRANKVTIQVSNSSLDHVLSLCFRNQPLTYTIVEKIVVVKPRQEKTIATVPVSVTDPVSVLNVKGKVMDEEYKAIPNATIAVKGTNKFTLSDAGGEFSLDQIPSNSLLMISCVGFQRQEVPVKGNPVIRARLKIAVNSLDETIVLAYRTSTRRNNVGAVSVVKGEEISTLPVRSIDRALQGLVPGLQVTSGNGSPGGMASNITLRGIATGGLGIARNPLFVVDGTPVQQEEFGNQNGTSMNNNPPPTNPLSQINPEDIESISVLKDAAAISIYGSQASNGVILITTKKGKAGRTRVNFSHQTDLSSPLKSKREVLNQEQYLGLLYESYKNANAQATDQSIFNDLKSKFPYQVMGGDTSFYPAPSWFDALYSDRALGINNNLSISGGNDKTTYYLGLGDVHQKGALRHTTFNRSSLRFNMDAKPANWFRLGLNTSLVYSHQNLGDLGDEITSATGFAYQVSPLLPIRQTNGQYVIRYPLGAGGTTIVNPVAAMDYNSRTVDGYRAIGNVFGEVKFLQHFTFRSNVGVDFLASKSRMIRDKRVGPSASFTGSVSDIRNERSILLVNNMLNFQKNFGTKHLLSVMAIHEAQIAKSNQLNGGGSGFTSGFADNEISSANATSASGDQSKATSVSYLAQLNYEYQNRYLTSVSYRLDGSSRFGSAEPYKSFWSIGAGWIATEEAFLRPANRWLSFLKLRGSVGIAGNSTAIPPITRSNRVSGVTYSNPTAQLGNTVLFTTGNPHVKPESTFNIDLGLETRLFRDRLTFTADVYRRKTYDMVTNLQDVMVSGRQFIYGNLGDLENKGIELSLSGRIIQTQRFSWNLAANWSTNSNKFVKASNPESYASKFIYKVGENFESWNLVRWAGVDPEDGAPQWLDIDGKTTKTFSNNDRLIVGKPQPDGFGGVTSMFTYRNFELSAFFYYAYGYQIYNAFLASMLNDGRGQPYGNQSVLALDRWQKPGDVAMNPKRVLNNPARGTSISTRYLVDGDHIRFKNLSLAYNLHESLRNRLKLASARIFVQVNNLGLLWVKGDAIDPDNTGTLGESGSAYPQQRTCTVGLSIGF